MEKLPEIYTPLGLMLAGGAGLGLLRLLRQALERPSRLHQNAQSWLVSCAERFEQRAHWSWLLLAVGAVWTTQVLLQDWL